MVDVLIMKTCCKYYDVLTFLQIHTWNSEYFYPSVNECIEMRIVVYNLGKYKV